MDETTVDGVLAWWEPRAALLGASTPGSLYGMFGVLAREVTHVRQVIREYVAHVESGERFDALVSAVPGLESDDGAYPTGELDRLRTELHDVRVERDEEVVQRERLRTEVNWFHRHLPCPCSTDPNSTAFGPLQECPLHGDGKSFAAYVEHLEQVKARACEVAEANTTSPSKSTDAIDAARYILGEDARTTPPLTSFELEF